MSARKSFKDNPALAFISPPPAARGQSPASEVPLKPNPLYLETRSKRLQLLMQPSLHQKLRDRAAEGGQSLNDLIHKVLEQWVEG